MIEVSHISKHFGNFKAVDDISFSIPTGQIVGLLGPNGAGKTTTMRLITGFWGKTSGSVKIDGTELTDDIIGAKSKIGYMPESAPLYPEMIVEDYLKYVANIYNQDPKVKIPLLCKTCGLSEVMHKNISELSRGYKQRVGLAHSLMNDPEILILDEPTSGLDPNQIEDVRSLIKEIGKTRTVIISTHILQEVETLCDRVIIIAQGRLVADSPTAELRERFGQRRAVNLTLDGCTFSEAKKVFSSLENVESITKRCDDFVLPSKKAVGLCVHAQGNQEIREGLFKAIVKNKWTLYEMTPVKNNLEDVFHILTQKNSGDNNVQ
ncbi:ABC transporter ATP-binding protein [Treponema sp.]|uniref:ABC transporter ATP-binding protein n=1 Tax=Treponema sp. TaxID=166 RepID=UPI00298EADB0|nr:ATP-binding cassette domain-containing protein [Treponema sp.]MCR5614102.1 ABC transporter ATP-binding protein [Treponema sp.]